MRSNDAKTPTSNLPRGKLTILLRKRLPLSWRVRNMTPFTRKAGIRDERTRAPPLDSSRNFPRMAHCRTPRSRAANRLPVERRWYIDRAPGKTSSYRRSRGATIACAIELPTHNKRLCVSRGSPPPVPERLLKAYMPIQCDFVATHATPDERRIANATHNIHRFGWRTTGEQLECV